MPFRGRLECMHVLMVFLGYWLHIFVSGCIYFVGFAKLLSAIAPAGPVYGAIRHLIYVYWSDGRIIIKRLCFVQSQPLGNRKAVFCAITAFEKWKGCALYNHSL